MAFGFSGVVLDLDGLLLDTERVQLETGPEVLRSFGYEVPPSYFETLVGVDRIESARRLNQLIDGNLDGALLDRAWNAAMDARMREAIPLRPGVNAFLDALDRHELPRAIATNSVTDRAEWKLRHAGLWGRIDALVGVDQVQRGKPEPDVYIEAARRLGLSPSLCAALDDSDPGIRAAAAAGMAIVIQVPDMIESREHLAHHQAASLDDAARILCL
jgi:beta-phosphoglucomutase